MQNILQLSRPAVVAHRGASAYAPENTLAAFRLAVEQGADAVELDAKLTRDGEVIVIHDQTVNRTTGGTGVVREMTLAQLKALDAGALFDPKYTGEPVPTLEEVFQAVGGKVVINVEITNYTSPTDALPDRIVDLIRKYRLEEWILFSSFHPLNLLRVRRKLPAVPAALLTQAGPAGRLLRGGLGRVFSPHWFHPYYTDVSAESLAQEHRRGRKVNVWTVNAAEDIRRLSRWGIDGIITDDPLLALRVLEEE